jgi:hypothetical protein
MYNVLKSSLDSLDNLLACMPANRFVRELGNVELVELEL